MRKWGPERSHHFHEVTWLVRVRAAGTPSWILTPDPSPAPQVSSSPLPTGPAQRRLSVSPSIGGETGLVSCVLPEDLLTQILAERIQVGPCPQPHPCTELRGSHTIPVLGAEVLIHSAPTAAQNLGRLGFFCTGRLGFFVPNSHLLVPLTSLVSPGPWCSLKPHALKF